MTDQERRHVTDLLAAHDALIHWCETLITAHADLVELASEAGPAEQRGDRRARAAADRNARRDRGAASARRTPPRGPLLEAARLVH